MHRDSSHCSNENAMYSTKPMKLEFNNYALHKPRDHEFAGLVHTACTPINVVRHIDLGLQLWDPSKPMQMQTNHDLHKWRPWMLPCTNRVSHSYPRMYWLPTIESLTTASPCSLFLVILIEINQHDSVYILRPFSGQYLIRIWDWITFFSTTNQYNQNHEFNLAAF
jgi:hypothetical protein